MNGYKLTHADTWFLQKGMKDALSRSEFAVGDRVLVCSNHHVMLEEFYSGECPTCHSRILIPFSRINASPAVMRSYSGNCPECGRNINVLFRQQGTAGFFISKCTQCHRELRVPMSFFQGYSLSVRWGRMISYINSTMLILLCLIIGIGSLLLFLSDDITEEKLLSDGYRMFFPSETLLAHLERVNRQFLKRCSTGLAVISSGFSMFWNNRYLEINTLFSEQNGLLKRILKNRTQELIVLFIDWLKEIINHFI